MTTTPAELAAMLEGVNVEAVAKAANVSTKTIYRIRQAAQPGREQYEPGLMTAKAIIDAVDAVRAVAKAKRALKRRAAKVAAA